MAERAFDLPITLRRIIKENCDFGIFLLEDKERILSPPDLHD